MNSKKNNTVINQAYDPFCIGLCAAITPTPQFFNQYSQKIMMVVFSAIADRITPDDTINQYLTEKARDLINMGTRINKFAYNDCIPTSQDRQTFAEAFPAICISHKDFDDYKNQFTQDHPDWMQWPGVLVALFNIGVYADSLNKKNKEED